MYFSAALRELDAKHHSKHDITEQKEEIEELGRVVQSIENECTKKDILLAENAVSLAEEEPIFPYLERTT